MGKANSQVLLEVIHDPRTEEELRELQVAEMIESVQQSSASLGLSQSNALRMSTISSPLPRPSLTEALNTLLPAMVNKTVRKERQSQARNILTRARS